MASKICWLFLVMLLSISTFGLWMCCIVVISAMSSLIGLAVMLYSGQELKFSINFNPKCLDFSRTSSPFNGIPKVTIRMNDSPIKKKSDLQLTGSNEIDAPLREILSHITRDFVCSWYKDVSTDEDFTNNFYEICKKLINNFSKSSREINWISFITQKVVEDFTTHLRLYRHAEAKFRRCQKEKLDTYPDIESAFFELESTLEKNICRKNVCTSIENENEYLQNVSDIILYLLLPPDDFNNKILKHFLREVMTCSLFQPLITQFSDPDVINQNLIWMCRDHPVSSKSLLGVLRRTDNKEELFAFRQITKHEIKVHNSKDTVDKDESKKYIKSITFVQEIANQRYERLSGLPKHGDTDSAEFYLSIDETDSPTPSTKERKLISLPFDVILTNNIALHYFTQYLANMDKDNYVFFYLNVESFRTTVEMLQSANLPQDGETATEKLRTLALQLFDSYLGSNATSKINLDETLLRKLLSRIKMENITIHCFDEVQEKVYDVLENEFYLTGFKDTKQYVKLLAELDLLNDSASLDLDSLSSSKSEEEEKLICDTVVPTDEEMLNELLNTEISVDDFDFPDMSSGPLPEENKEIGLIFAEVHSTGITHHAGRTFAVYAISVSHHRMEGPEEKWFVVRRYSEFYDFHEMLIEKYPMLAYFNFPAKKPFNNLTRQLMEKRRHMLNEFMQFLLSPDILAACDGLNVMIYNFLQPNVCEKGKRSFIRSVGNFVNPIKSSVRTVGNIVKLVPDTFFELKDGLVKALSKSGDNERTQSFSASKPLPSDNPRTEDIPFRIILLLMDEVFNLRNKDLWFRRRIMALLRQIIKTMQGGSINRKIKDYVQGLTSATQIAEWLKLLSKSIWPDGVLADSTPERDHNTKMRTRIVAKMLLFCAIPDELKHIIGYETSFKGAMLIFNMFQHPALNNRLLIVLLESLLIALFPNNNMPELFQKLHSSSLRTTSILKDLAQTDIKEQPTVSEESQSIAEKSLEEDEVKVIEIKEKPTLKVAKESRGKLMKQCLSLQSVRSPKLSKKKTTRSMDTAIFYTDYDDNEDTVILPLGR